MEATIASTLLEVEELLNLSLISSNEFVAIRHSILSSSNSSARKHEIMSPRERRHASGAVAVPAVKHKQQQLKPKKSAYHNQHSRNRTANIVPLSSFASLVLSQSTALKQSRHVSAVCCGKCSGGGTNAFFFRGSHWRHGVLMLEHGRKGSNDNSSSDLRGSSSGSGSHLRGSGSSKGRGGRGRLGNSSIARDTTVLVSSSARPRDDSATNLAMLTDSLKSVRRELHLGGAHAVLIFDGLDGKPGTSEGIRRRYAMKIARAIERMPEVDALVCEDWQHQANALRCALQSVPRTPLIFVIQDDTQIGPGGVDTNKLHRILSSDPMVEYVRFATHTDCADPKTRRFYQSYSPCTPHTSGLLQRTTRWLDRPHFATRRHYDQRLFDALPLEARVTPEQYLDQKSRVAKPGQEWPLWMYGARGDMQRDLHWPQRGDDGRLVSKEFLPSNRSKYVHSYLIHAYRGRTQDVGLAQINQKLFRAHNPLAWTVEDGLTKADE